MTARRTLLIAGLAAAVLAHGPAGGTALSEGTAPQTAAPAPVREPLGGALVAADQPPDEFVLRTYDVRGILAVGTRYTPTPLGVHEGLEAASGRRLSVVREGRAAALSTSDREMEAELLRLVRDAAGPGGWAPAGEGAAVIREGLLSVWQRPSAQARIAGLLARLRRRGAQMVIIRVGLYVCSAEAARQVHEGLKVSDLEPVHPLLPEDAPPIKGALLKPDQVAAAVQLLSRTPGSRALLSATIPCLPVREAAVEDLRQVLFVSDLDPRAGSGFRGPGVDLKKQDSGFPAPGTRHPTPAPEPLPGAVTAGWVVLLNPVPSADLGRVQLGVRARLAHLVAIEADTRTIPAEGDEPGIEVPVHRPTVRSTALDMTLVVPTGVGVLVSGPPVTVGDEWGRPISGQLMGVFWPSVSEAATTGPVAADDLATLKAALDRPIDWGVKNAAVSEALAELTRQTGLKIEVTARSGVNDGPALLARRVTFGAFPITPLEVLATLLGDRVEQVVLEPPDAIRLTVGPADAPLARSVAAEASVGTLTVRSADGRIVTRMNVRRRDLTPEVRMSIENLLNETLRRQ